VNCESVKYIWSYECSNCCKLFQHTTFNVKLKQGVVRFRRLYIKKLIVKHSSLVFLVKQVKQNISENLPFIFSISPSITILTIVPFFDASFTGKALIIVTSWPATIKPFISFDVSILWLIPGMGNMPNILAHSDE